MSTEILGTDEISQSDNDKFTTHNTANRQIEGQLTRVISRTAGGPPGGESNGDIYIVDVASGDWASATVGDIAHYYGGQYNFYTPAEGVQKFWVSDEDILIAWDGSAWVNSPLVSVFGGTTLTAGAVAFINATADGLELDATNFFWDDGNNRLGIGTNTPKARLHTSKGDSGQATVNASADALLVEDNSDNGISILTPSTNIGSIFFGDESDNFVGGFRYDHSVDTLTVFTGNGERFRIDSGGKLSTGGETAPDVDNGGLCLNTGTNDGYTQTLKNSDVAHTFTSIGESDTYAAFRKASNTAGGFQVNGYSSGANTSMLFQGHSQTAPAAKGIFRFSGRISDGGTSVTSLGASDKLMSIENNGSNVAMFTASGLGLGTDSPTEKFEVVGGGIAAGNGTIKTVISYSTRGIFGTSSNHDLEIRTNNTNRLFLADTGEIATGGETSPDVDSGGICINHGANDGYAVTLKNSDVAHGITSFAETDTYGALLKDSATAGGLRVAGFTETDVALRLLGYGTTANTTSTGLGAIDVFARKKSGTSVTAYASNENIFSVNNNGSVVEVTKGNGDKYLAGGIALSGGTDYLAAYEEDGTATLTASPTTSGTITLNSSVDDISYTKIGNAYIIKGQVNVSAVSSPVGTRVSFAGLPAASGNLVGNSNRTAVHCRMNDGTTASVVPAYLLESSSTIEVEVDASTITTSHTFIFNFTYTE